MPQSEYDLVIVGSGLAGYTLAREYRKLNKTSSLLLISRDDGVFYSKPMLSNALAGNKTPEQLVMKPVEKMREELAADIRVETDITAIDPQAHRLASSQGEVTYGQLVLGVGATPRQLPLQGEAADEVISVNDLTAYRTFRQQLEGKQQIAVIGPGLVGCEFANDLLRSGHRVQVIGPDPYPLSLLLPEAVGQHMQQVLGNKGFEWYLERTVARIDRQEGGLRLTLSDSTELQSDFILSAAGLVPNTELAEAAGLKVNRGIAVDRRLATSAPDIYALGDCAEVDGLWLPYVMPIMNAARALAKTLAGEPTDLVYPPMPVVVKTPDFPLVISPPPKAAGDGHWQIDRDDDGMRALFVDADERLLGFILTEDKLKEKQSLAKQLPNVLDS
ncbi:NAD(P)/FAD-dependent oxidoreductase [Thiohalophilus sp.]|uniref:NAD(P)/FAD-dependent oxidoreductase n=1 Tax=Thiohalophilus sp. TaxID=3028392 RepID=UPI002ACD887E|nr:FAD-dependent oxidoreductase [Thiohalophilus sp.]MDZ7803279.1 FAD-dependent oxidoreductase [Thiohalophilus sp.]